MTSSGMAILYIQVARIQLNLSYFPDNAAHAPAGGCDNLS
jgi:hypothetical protein